MSKLSYKDKINIYQERKQGNTINNPITLTVIFCFLFIYLCHLLLYIIIKQKDDLFNHLLIWTPFLGHRNEVFICQN